MTRLDPIVLQASLSDEQKKALQTHGDVAVTAGAGAGKTRTLVARYLSLLADGLTPRQAVAITFTRKAAREMRNRVRQEIGHYLEKPGIETSQRTYWQEVYNALDAARIGTIHSLCGEILRHHPAEARVDPRFEMLDEGQAALLKAQVVEETLAGAADDAQTVPLFTWLGEKDLRQLLKTMLSQPLDAREALSALPQDEEALRTYWDTAVSRSREDALESLLADSSFVTALDLIREISPLDRQDRLVVQWQQVLDAVGMMGTPSADALPALDQIRLNVGSQKAWPGGKEELQEVKTALGTLRDLWRAAAEWLTLELTEVDQTLIAHYPALRTLFDRASQRYAELKKERPALDFDDLEAGALQLLQTQPAVCAYWQEQVQALLVDEFQDTNERQRRLFDLLNGNCDVVCRPGKLFIVGDGKQSIYRFRGADVTVFRQKRQEIEKNGRIFDLDTSYRAHQALIEGLNALLEPILGKNEDLKRPFVEPFAPLRHHRVSPITGMQPPFIEIHITQGAKREGALEQAARAVVVRLVELVEHRQITVQGTASDDRTQQTRALNYGDIAILCRASGSFSAYENALDSAGVPFLTVSGRGFYDRPEVRDVLSALQALADPTDDLALAGLLRSPGCGLSDMGLYRLVQARRTRTAPSLWAVLCDDDLAFLEDEAITGQAIRDLVQKLHAMVERVPVADVLKAFLDATAYRAALLRAGQARGARNLAKLLSDALASEIVSVGTFLEYIQQLRDAGTREGEAHTVATGAVQIMSVHAAKGLEFPIVVIGDAGRQAPRVKNVLIDPALGVLPSQENERIAHNAAGQPEVQKVRSAIYRLAQRAAQDRDDAEFDRLLYVAATRAKDVLLISGVEGRGLDGWLKRLNEALPLKDCLKDNKDAQEPQQMMLDAAGQPVVCTIYPDEMDVLLPTAVASTPPALALPETLPLLEKLLPDLVVVDEQAREETLDPPRRVWRVVPETTKAAAPAWVVGKIVHSALEQWLFPDSAPFDWYTWAAAEAQSCGVTDQSEARDAAKRAERILTRFESTDLHTRMAAATQRFHEVSYSQIDDQGQLEHGVIDALFQDESGWALVEFKTDYVKDAKALENKLADQDYVPQVARYLAAAERRLGERPRPVLCLLNYAGAVHLVEDRW